MSEDQYFTPPYTTVDIPVPLSGSTYVEPVNKDSSHIGSTVSTDSFIILQIGSSYSYITEGINIAFRPGSGFSSWRIVNDPVYDDHIEIYADKNYTVSEYNILLSNFYVSYYDTLLAQFYIYF